MNLHIDDCPTPRVEWLPSREPDRAAHGYHYGREIFIDHVPDDAGIAVWRIRVHYGTSNIECQRIHRGTLEDAMELAAWMACDLSRRDADGLVTAVRLGYAILPCSLTHCAVIDPAGNQFDNVPYAAAYALVDRLTQEPPSQRAPEGPRNAACIEASRKYLEDRRLRRDYAQGAPVSAEALCVAVGPAKEEA